MKIFYEQTRFKNFERNPERESVRRTKSTSGGLESLQMISEPNIGRSASKELVPRRWVDLVTNGFKARHQIDVPVRRLFPEGGRHEVVCQ